MESIIRLFNINSETSGSFQARLKVMTTQTFYQRFSELLYFYVIFCSCHEKGRDCTLSVLKAKENLARMVAEAKVKEEEERKCTMPKEVDLIVIFVKSF